MDNLGFKYAHPRCESDRTQRPRNWPPAQARSAAVSRMVDAIQMVFI